MPMVLQLCTKSLQTTDWPVRSSLYNLVISDYSNVTMLTSGLARTSDRHRHATTSGPELKPSCDSSLQATGLLVHATTPGDITFNHARTKEMS
eukprot:gene3865-4406_t